MKIPDRATATGPAGAASVPPPATEVPDTDRPAFATGGVVDRGPVLVPDSGCTLTWPSDPSRWFGPNGGRADLIADAYQRGKAEGIAEGRRQTYEHEATQLERMAAALAALPGQETLAGLCRTQAERFRNKIAETGGSDAH
ncbi:hypothetical protein GCM10010399_44250 [Dactylosporangium fulvum]|uniref:Uncharacterized protein n=1 Tax=Dactylosporangium fulvum TaxID=53359 RepID=A0ABY5W7Q4_9ACTN|nr:hypothetical protein [Dactylosporangium fulvum]UWP85907.1 hypothetical protein Dfulv_17310 [Dactylosporangium fulvum]